MSPRSSRAIANAKAICEQHLKGRYELQVVDVYQQRALAQRDEIVAVPMLVKLRPLPMRRIIGDLSDTDHTIRALDLRQQK